MKASQSAPTATDSWAAASGCFVFTVQNFSSIMIIFEPDTTTARSTSWIIVSITTAVLVDVVRASAIHHYFLGLHSRVRHDDWLCISPTRKTSSSECKKNIYSHVTTGTHRNKGRGFVLCDLSRTFKHRSLTGCRCSVSLESIVYMATGLLKQKRWTRLEIFSGKSILCHYRFTYWCTNQQKE